MIMNPGKQKEKIIGILLASVFLPVLFSACCRNELNAPEPRYSDSLPGGSLEIYTFSTHPLFSEQRVFELFGPVIQRVNRQALRRGFQLKLVTAPDYASYERRLYAGDYDISLPNPLQTLESLDCGYMIFGKVADDKQFCGIILGRKDDNYSTIAELKGKTLTFPSRTALAACMMPSYFLLENGIDVRTDVESVFTGNQESTIMSLSSGLSDIAVTWPPPWMLFRERHPEEAAGIRELWRTPHLVNNGLVASVDLPRDVLDLFSQVLYQLDRDAEGREFLDNMGYSGFEPATFESFRPVREFLDDYYRNFPGEQPQ